MLDLEHHDAAVVVRVRPAARRVLTAELLDSLVDAIAYIGPARPVVITGSQGVFVPDLDPVAGPVRAAASVRLPRALGALRAHPNPVVAALNGDAIGAGHTLAEAADIRVMSAGIVQPTSGSAGGHRAPEALALGLIEIACGRDELLDLALGQVDELTRGAVVMG